MQSKKVLPVAILHRASCPISVTSIDLSMPQKSMITMVSIPTPVPRLCLTLEFDIDGTKERPSNEKHDAAIKDAAKTLDEFIHFSQYGVTPDAFSAKVIDGTSINDPDRRLQLSSAHNEPFDPKFHVPYGGPAIRYEFIYTIFSNGTPSTTSKLFLRIVTSFGKPEETIDGVLATRIGLTALEILQGNEVHPTIFPKHPPAPDGFRLWFNFYYHNHIKAFFDVRIGYMLFYLYRLLELIGLKRKGSICTVNSVASLLKFHDSKYNNQNAHYHVYRSETNNAFRIFLDTTEKWTKRLGLGGYFYLINTSPLAAPAITNNIQDITNLQTRYRGAFAPPGPPPGEEIWKQLNYTIADKIIVNNYGVHKHNFSAKPVSFIWDWLDIRNTSYTAACISINGTFMCCFRGLESSLDKIQVNAGVFPAPPTTVLANSSWRKTMYS